ncbi:uncharacterized protein LOC117169809 [Belonocnema kinseyi]|uniref:uncharacterized protein LOC117169809 n=1 Tax=Belonocnema kinseyi TaxID=2817044 RepID=UPI00143D6749|nr:uncharacterized protein LOC117169809 [Belonocnema kinseyi]
MARQLLRIAREPNDRMQRDDTDDFQIEIFVNADRTPEAGLLRIKVFSRFHSARIHQLWIAYQSINEDDETIDEEVKLVQGHYCTCESGARTIKAKSPEIEKLWEEVKTRLTKVADDINNQIPNAKEQAATLQAKLQDGIKVVVEESQKASKAFNENSGKVQEDIAKFTKQAVDLAVQTTQSLSDQLKKAADAPK